MSTVLIKNRTARVETDGSERDSDGKAGPETSTTSVNTVPPLGEAVLRKRFWFERNRSYDADAVATQASPRLHVVGALGVWNTRGADSPSSRVFSTTQTQ